MLSHFILQILHKHTAAMLEKYSVSLQNIIKIDKNNTPTCRTSISFTNSIIGKWLQSTHIYCQTKIKQITHVHYCVKM